MPKNAILNLIKLLLHIAHILDKLGHRQRETLDGGCYENKETGRRGVPPAHSFFECTTNIKRCFSTWSTDLCTSSNMCSQGPQR